ncbi:type II toxin-antitoxin system VapC family toxin [Rhodobacteraceae bacterium CCMM004]|nr:type II toxin-antitoxin system VapC family toxin [Rhodobacteraceae bacterium CCMM004]
MNLLLDTHVLLWAAFVPDRIPERTQARLLDAGNVLWFSAVSIWEVATKRGLGRPDFTVDPGRLRAGLLQNGYAELPLESRHTLVLATLPDHHADPFDRMLVVQAAAEGMVVLTADRNVARDGGPAEMV